MIRVFSVITSTLNSADYSGSPCRVPQGSILEPLLFVTFLPKTYTERPNSAQWPSVYASIDSFVLLFSLLTTLANLESF